LRFLGNSRNFGGFLLTKGAADEENPKNEKPPQNGYPGIDPANRAKTPRKQNKRTKGAK